MSFVDRIDASKVWQSFIDDALCVDTLVPSLGSTVDMSRSCRGIALVLRRVYGTSLASRRRKGILGLGWSYAFQSEIRAQAGRVAILDGLANALCYSQTRSGGPWSADDVKNAATLAEGETTWLLTTADGILMTYDKSTGRLSSVADRCGNRVTYSYASGGALLGMRHSDGQLIDFTSDSSGRIVRAADDIGNAVSYAYDADGNLAQVTYLDGRTVGYRYLPAGKDRTSGALSSIVSHIGATFDLTWDSDGYVMSSALNGSYFPREIVRESLMGKVTLVDPDGSTVCLACEDSEGMTSLTDQFGNKTARFSDRTDQHRYVDYPDGVRESGEYTVKGLMLKSVSGSGATVSFRSSEEDGRLLELIDARGLGTSFGYDDRGLLKRIGRPDGSSESYEIDARGDVTAFVNARGQRIEISYDEKGRLVSVRLPDGRTYTYAYGAFSRLVEVVDSLRGRTRFGYDQFGRMTCIDHPNGHAVVISRDGYGRVNSVLNEDGIGTACTYDALGRVASVSDGTGAVMLGFRYDPVTGHPIELACGNGTRTAYGLAADGLVTDITVYGPDDSVLEDFTCAFDVRRRPVETKARVRGWNERYEYDRNGQLAKWSGNLGGETYYYDAAGNRTYAGQSRYVIDTQSDRCKSISSSTGTVEFEYDADGNVITRTSGGETMHYFYDALNRLVAATNDSRTVRWSCVYGAFGEMAKIDANGEVTERVYLADFTTLLDEYDASGKRLRHHYSSGGIRFAVQTEDGVRYLHGDGIGSVRFVTDAVGGVVGRADYQPYGRLAASSGDASLCGWLGRWGVERQKPLGLHLMGLRHYSDETGRFMQHDPLDVFSGEINLYRYAFNSPAEFIDPEGLRASSGGPGCDDQTSTNGDKKNDPNENDKDKAKGFEKLLYELTGSEYREELEETLLKTGLGFLLKCIPSTAVKPATKAADLTCKSISKFGIKLIDSGIGRHGRMTNDLINDPMGTNQGSDKEWSGSRLRRDLEIYDKTH